MILCTGREILIITGVPAYQTGVPAYHSVLFSLTEMVAGLFWRGKTLPEKKIREILKVQNWKGDFSILKWLQRNRHCNMYRILRYSTFIIDLLRHLVWYHVPVDKYWNKLVYRHIIQCCFHWRKRSRVSFGEEKDFPRRKSEIFSRMGKTLRFSEFFIVPPPNEMWKTKTERAIQFQLEW